MNNMYREELNNIISSELRKRCESDEYNSFYKNECARILLERGDISQEDFAQITEEDDTEKTPYERTVPKTLVECYKSDSDSNAIWKLSKGVEKAGTIFLVIIIIVGIAVSLLNSYVAENAEEVDGVFNAGMFLISMASWIMYAIIEYWVFEFVAKLLAGLASIVQSNKITSNVALYMAKNKE